MDFHQSLLLPAKIAKPVEISLKSDLVFVFLYYNYLPE
jgi:hypothetical protein